MKPLALKVKEPIGSHVHYCIENTTLRYNIFFIHYPTGRVYSLDPYKALIGEKPYRVESKESQNNHIFRLTYMDVDDYLDDLYTGVTFLCESVEAFEEIAKTMGSIYKEMTNEHTK